MNQSFTEPELHARLILIRYPLYTCYVIFGAPAVLTNLIILVVLACEKKLLKKSAMIVGLAGGNLFSGLHAFGFGVYRIPLLNSNSIEMPASIWLCMASMLPTCMLLGYSLPAAMQFVIGLERLLAMGAFKWYSVHWSSKKSWYTVAAVYVVMILVWVVPVWYKDFSSYRTVTKECSSASTIDRATTSSLIVFIVGAGTAGVICVSAAVVIGRCRYSKLPQVGNQNETSKFKNQLRFCRIMSVVALADFIFVVLPNVFTVLSDYLPTSLASMLGLCSTLIYCINSMTSVFIYLGMNSRFRRVALTKLKILVRLICPICNAVAPSNAQ